MNPPSASLPLLPGQQVPSDVQNAQADTGDQNYNDYCEKFVEQQAYGQVGLFPTAAAAIDYYSQNGQAYAGDKGIEPGDLVYFAPDQSNGYAGHTGIYSGDGNFVSATANGVQEYSLDKWEKDTGQQLVGYVPPPQASSQKAQ